MDKINGGLVPSSVSILLAPPKEFKSALAMNICYNAAKRGIYSYHWLRKERGVILYAFCCNGTLYSNFNKRRDNTMNAMEESRWIQFITSVKEGKHQILNKIYFDEVPPSI